MYDNPDKNNILGIKIPYAPFTIPYMNDNTCAVMFNAIQVQGKEDVLCVSYIFCKRVLNDTNPKIPAVPINASNFPILLYFIKRDLMTITFGLLKTQVSLAVDFTADKWRTTWRNLAEDITSISRPTEEAALALVFLEVHDPDSYREYHV